MLAWTGSDSHLNLATSRGLEFSEPSRLDFTSRVSPALSTFGATVALAWTGTDFHLNVAVEDAAEGRFLAEWRLEETSREGPALCAMGSATFIAWVGTDDHLNVGLVQDGSVRYSLRLDDRTFYEPGLVIHAGDLILVWTGIRGEVGVTQLGTPTVAGKIWR